MSLKEESDRLRKIRKVREAAEYCGVSTETLFDLDQAGKLVAIRHPLTSYRYYERDELKGFVKRSTRERNCD